MKTNTLFHYVEVFGEKELISAINNAESKAAKDRMSKVTNPILRFLIHTTKIEGQKLHANFSAQGIYYDHSIFNFTSSLLKILSRDIKANSRYHAELKRQFLGMGEGPALSGISELTAAAFYKTRGHKIILSASTDKGKPDVDILGSPYATDAKLFPNQRLKLNATVNESGKQIHECFHGSANGTILVMLLKSDKSEFKKSLKLLGVELKKGSFSYYRDTNIVALVIDAVDSNRYQAGDISITVINRNLSIVFQAGWSMDEPVAEFQKSLTVSAAQAKSIKKRAITWLMIPGDASRHAMEMQMLRYVTGTDAVVQAGNNLEGLVVFSIDEDKSKPNSFNSAVDIYGTGPTDLGITKESLSKFLSEALLIKEVLLS
jgi:hypothetical protein